MLLTFLKTWRDYTEGRTYDVPDGAARIYIQRGVAESAEPKKPLRPAKPKTKEE